MESQLDHLAPETVEHMTAPQRRALGVRMAATAWRELGPSSSAAKVAAYITPHCQRLGLSASKRTTERWAGEARTEQIQGLDPTDIERTRALLGTDARASAMSLFSLSDAFLPPSALVRQAIESGDTAKVSEYGARTRLGIKASEAALTANAQVIRLYGLDRIPPIGEVLTAPEQRTKAIELFIAIAPRLAPDDAARLRKALDLGKSQDVERPELSLLRGGADKEVE